MLSHNVLGLTRRERRILIGAFVVLLCITMGFAFASPGDVSIGGANNVFESSITATNVDVSVGVLPGAPSYTVYAVGFTYYAKAANGTIITAWTSTVYGDVVNNAVANGGTVILASSATLTKTITIHSNTEVIGANNLVITLANGANCHAFYANEESNITFRSVTLNGNKLGQTLDSRGFYLRGVSNVLLDSIVANNFYQMGISFVNGATTDRRNSNITIFNPTTDSNGNGAVEGIGIEVAVTDHATVIGHHGNSNLGDGLWIYASTSIDVFGGCYSNGGGVGVSTGIYFQDTTHATVYSPAIINQNGNGITFYRSHNITIFDPSIQTVLGGDGIKIGTYGTANHNSTNIKVIGGTISYAAALGIGVYNCSSDCIISDVTVHSCGQHGIGVYNTNGTKVCKNTVDGSPSGYAGIALQTAYRSIVSENTVTGNGHGINEGVGDFNCGCANQVFGNTNDDLITVGANTYIGGFNGTVWVP